MTLKKRKQHQQNNQSSCKVTEWAQVLRFSPLIFRFNCLRKRDTCYHSIEHLRWVVWKHRRGQYGKFYVRSWMIVIFKNVSRDGFTKFRKGWLGHLPAITNFLLYWKFFKMHKQKISHKKKAAVLSAPLLYSWNWKCLSLKKSYKSLLTFFTFQAITGYWKMSWCYMCISFRDSLITLEKVSVLTLYAPISTYKFSRLLSIYSP